MRAHTIIFAILALAMMAVLPLGSQGAPQKAAAVASTVNRAGLAAKSNQASADQEFSLAEGEKRFHQNCGRCHVAPDKFTPRVMATVLRHMRVRATITDRDAKLILWYMTR